MIGLSLSQSLLRPRQSVVALAAAEEHEAHGHGGGGHIDPSRSRESSVLLYTRGQLQLPQHRMMSVAVTGTGVGLGSGHRGARRQSSRRASECPFELLDPRSQSALAAARRRSSSARSSSARSGSLASSAFIERSRVNTSISAPEAQLHQSQHQHLLPIPVDVDVDIDEAITQPVAGEALATVRRKEPRQSSHHEQQPRRESASELKLRMRAFSHDSACAVIPEEPSDANSDSASGFRRISQRISEESAAAVAAAAAVAVAGTGTAPVASLAARSTSATERDGEHTQSQTQLPSSAETLQPQLPDRSCASSSSFCREKALLAQCDTLATPSRQAIPVCGDAEQELLDDVEEADEALSLVVGDFNHFTHVRPSDEVWHTLLWGAAVALLLLVSGKLLQLIESAFEASGVALIASADYSLERALEALIRSCANNCTNSSTHSGGGAAGGSVNCSDPQSSVAQFVDELRSVLEQQIANRYATDPSKNKWTFANAVFFQWTAITTIGLIQTFGIIIL